MALKFISGKPGAGKSYMALKWIVDELINGSRVVVTNLPINIPELGAYLHEKTEKIVDLSERLRIIGDDEVYEFYRYRGRINGEWYCSPPSDSKGRIDYSEYMCFKGSSILYVLDEVHLYFNSRDWQKTGRSCIWYLSQHRHLGDDVVAVTQFVPNVDKQFRSIAQDYTYARNRGKEKLFGFFAGPKRCFWSTYFEPYTGQQVASEFGTYKIDVTGLAKCYDTSAGAGLPGSIAADKHQTIKGIPWWVIIIVVVGALAGLFFAPDVLGKAFNKTSENKSQVNTNRPQSQIGFPNSSNINRVLQVQPVEVSPLQSVSPQISQTNVVKKTGVITGISEMNGEVTVWLDGKPYSTKNGLQAYDKEMCLIKGKKYKIELD